MLRQAVRHVSTYETVLTTPHGSAPLAYLPLPVIWLGIGEMSKILLLFLAIFAPVALAARAGVRSVASTSRLRFRWAPAGFR